MTITMERVDENTRVVNGSQKFTVNRRSGVDLWDIRTERGPVPRVLEGAFTTPNHAFDAIKNYSVAKTITKDK